ncbi:hypothetical protein RJ639_029838 [Escallonia herrerae]|uniref:Uncharacterized protein n=1 Tax=Escallonia herrerae TaxID=1293975 RepID=A0AA88X5H9_9ASTE|nr:hypothetical protein RJ639_029838 [Escallonia herrerae]
MEDGGAGADGGGAVRAADAGVVVSDSGEGESSGVWRILLVLCRRALRYDEFYCTPHAKIKKKQHLVKKELEAVISKDDFRNLAQTEGMKTTEDNTAVTNYTLSSRLLHDSCQSKIPNFNFSMISIYKDIITFQVPVNYRRILRVKVV